jgi:hypothetical protein
MIFLWYTKQTVCPQNGMVSRKPVEIVIWLWVNIWKRLVSFEALRVAGIFGLIAGLFFGLNDQDLLSGILFGLFFGLIAGFFFELIGRLAGGLSSETLDKRAIITPNQGIRRSARNSIIIGLGGGLISGLLFGLITWFLVTPNFECLRESSSYPKKGHSTPLMETFLKNRYPLTIEKHNS